jgi:hypothetical protein
MPTDKQIAEWVVIIIISLFVFFPHEMIYLSETSLGKLFFAVAIVYMTSVDISYGIATCCLVILFYQLDLYRGIVSIHRDTLLKEHMSELRDSLPLSEVAKEKTTESFKRGDSTVYSYSPYDDTENFYENSIMWNGEKNRELKDVFRKANCDAKGQLVHKGAVVRPEMSDYVFRELEFPKNGTAKCNPCNRGCSFSIIESRIDQEDDLVRPKSSNDANLDLNSIVGHYLVQPINSMIEDAIQFKNRFAEYL